MGRGGRNSSRGRGGGGGGDGFSKAARGRGGGGGGNGRGRGRGGIGAAVLSGNSYMQSLAMGEFTPFSSGFNTNAQTQSPANRGGNGRGGRGGRGRGRGRGGIHSVQSQHAVGFDYSALAPRSIVRQSNQDELDDDSDDEEDIIIEARKGYVHSVKPHLENDQRTPPDTPRIVHGYQSFSDSENIASSSRTSPTPAEKARAERIRTGQIAAVIPTGPKSLTPFRVNNSKANNQLPADLPVFKPATSNKKSKKEFVRPMEDPLEDACMGGIPRGMRKRQSRFDRGESSLRRFEAEKRNPPSFVKANGDWKDGKWIRTSEDGPESLVEESKNSENVGVSDNVTRSGLGFNAASTSQSKVEVRNHEEEEDAIFELMKGDDTVEELLKAFPGSAVLQDSGNVDESLGYYSAPSDLGLGRETIHSKQTFDVTDGHEITPAPKAEATEDNDEEDDDDIEIILVDQKPSAISEPAAKSTVETNMEMPDSKEKEEVEDDDDGFFVDTVGEETKPKNEIQYESITSVAVGEVLPEQEMPANASTGEDDEEWKSEGEGEDFVQLYGEGQPGRKVGKKARNAAKKARRKARKNGFTLNEEPPIAREGDSDLDWGSDGPPVRFRNKGDQIDFTDGDAELSLDQLRLNAVSSAPRNTEEEETQLAIALAESMGSKGKANGANKALFKSQKDAILDDYMQNAMGGNNSDSDEMEEEERDDTKENQETELDAMLRFMQGMDGQRSGKEITIDDINVERQLEEEDEWMTDSDAKSNDESEDSEAERVFNHDEKRLANESESSDLSSDDSDDSEDDDDDDEDEEEDEDEDDDSDDEEDIAFERNFTWADADEDFIARLDKFAQANEEVLKGRNRGARNKLYRAIERGDFSMLDEDDMLNNGIDGMDFDDPVFNMQPAKRGKNAKKTWKDDDVWAQELQSQWQKDRAKKADNKRKRAEQRALEADNPFHNSNGKGKGMNKKQQKKAARAARRAERVNVRQSGNMRDIDMVDELFGGRGFASSRREDPVSRHAVTLIDVNRQIELFMYDVSKTTLSLAPMDKRARAQVHQLASCYNLISKSKGSGNHRFPTLIKNSRSGFNVKQGRVNAILRSVGGASFGKGSRTGANAPKDDGRKKKERIPLPRNQEGAQVGFGAERIGQDNVGHRLLSAMGWVEGMGVGATQGMSDPVGATIKISRGGLGF
ncbi:hypothetical protein L7F22_019590 [Adiantum nelumboides]|nr:hypothetical protein [Adiantum nelumboides]